MQVKVLPNSMSLRTLLAAPAAMDSYYADERKMWRHLKASAFYENMHFCVATGMPLPFADWLRMLLQVPGSMRIRELARIFDEEVRDAILRNSFWILCCAFCIH